MKNSNPRQNMRLSHEKLAHTAYVHQVHQHLKINRNKLKKQECQMKTSILGFTRVSCDSF